MANIITYGPDGAILYTPYSLSAMCAVILGDIPYDLDNRASAVDFIIKGA